MARDIGMLPNEVATELKLQRTILHRVLDQLKNIEAALGHPGYNVPERRELEQRRIEIESRITRLRESGVIPWLANDGGNTIGGDDEIWVSRVIVKEHTYDLKEGKLSSEDVPAIKIHARTSGGQGYLLTITDRGVAEELLKQLQWELMGWDED